MQSTVKDILRMPWNSYFWLSRADTIIHSYPRVPLPSSWKGRICDRFEFIVTGGIEGR